MKNCVTKFACLSLGLMILGCADPLKLPENAVIPQSTPRDLLATYNWAAQEHNYAMIFACIQPSRKNEFREYCACQQRLFDNIKETGRLIETRIGPEEAKQYLANMKCTLHVDPIQMDQVRFVQHGNKTSIVETIDGEKVTAMTFIRLKDKWYLTKPPGALEKDDENYGMIRILRYFVSLSEKPIRDIKAGKVNKKNFKAYFEIED